MILAVLMAGLVVVSQAAAIPWDQGGAVPPAATPPPEVPDPLCERSYADDGPRRGPPIRFGIGPRLAGEARPDAEADRRASARTIVGVAALAERIRHFRRRRRRGRDGSALVPGNRRGLRNDDQTGHQDRKDHDRGSLPESRHGLRLT